MKKFLIILFYVLPFCAFAHAAPVSYEPARGAVLESSPAEIAVTMTERVDPASAALTLFMATGSPQVLSVTVDAQDPYTIRALTAPVVGGATAVWGVTSLEDGHYTHGAFNFEVGGGAPPVSSQNERLMNEGDLSLLLLISAALLLFLRLVSILFRRQYCVFCVRSRLILEVLVSCTALVLGVLLVATPIHPFWEKHSTKNDVDVQLRALEGVPFVFVQVSSKEDINLPTPLFEVSNRAAGVDPMPITLTLYSEDEQGTTYTFPTSVFVPTGEWHTSVTFVRDNYYDVHGAMTFVYPEEVAAAMNGTPAHTTRAWLALLAALFALLLIGWRRGITKALHQ